jgi:glutathione S-transferase
VASVLDGVLSKQKYLVGDYKLTVADISFYPWNYVLFDFPELLGNSPFKQEVEQLKHFMRWHEEIGRLPSVQKAYSLRATF